MNRLSKCVFPIAGKGTRFYPVTKSIPKEMLPVGRKPLIHHAIDEACDADFLDIIFITNKSKKAIQNYFTIDSSYNNEQLETLNNLINKINVKNIFQERMLGLGHAISLSSHQIDDEPFAVILPDDYCPNTFGVIGQLKKVYQNYPDKCIVAVEEVSSERVNQYGIVSFDKKEASKDVFQLSGLIEKPEISIAPSNYAVIGRYIFTPEIFQYIEKKSSTVFSEIQITTALNQLAKLGKVIGVKFKGKRFDCGNLPGYIEANLSSTDS